MAFLMAACSALLGPLLPLLLLLLPLDEDDELLDEDEEDEDPLEVLPPPGAVTPGGSLSLNGLPPFGTSSSLSRSRT